MSSTTILEPKKTRKPKKKIPKGGGKPVAETYPPKKRYDPEPYGEPPGEPVVLEPVPCSIEIKADVKQLSFSPPLGLSGEETITAEPSRNLAEGERVQWSVVRGPNDGNVEFDSPSSLTTKMRARKPNKTKVRVQLLGPEGAVICQDEKDISVPQFFFLRPTPGLALALQDFGLQVPIAANDSLRDRKAALNGQILQQTLIRAAGLAVTIYQGINVRFTTVDPTAAVGAGNFATVQLLGLAPNRDVTGLTETGRDEGNKIANDRLLVYAGEFSDPAGSATASALARRIFRGIAVRQQRVVGGRTSTVPLPGTPVQLGEFRADRELATTFRQLRINAAFLALARLIGSTIAHECGHGLGLVPAISHNARADGNLMDKGGTRSFEERTGILRFAPSSGALSFTSPAGLTLQNRRTLQQVLPVFR